MRLTKWLWFGVMLCGIAAFAVPPKKNKVDIPANVPKQFVGREAAWLKNGLPEEYLISRLKNIAKDFSQGKSGRMLTVAECQARSAELKRIAAYYFFEADTEISRAWMQGTVKFADALTGAQDRLLFLIANKQTASDEYRQWYEYYRKTVEDFTKLIAKPIRIKDKKRLARMLKIKKAVLERELAAEQAKRDSAPKLDDSKPSRKK